MYCERTYTFCCTTFKLHIMDTCCFWNLVCYRLSIVDYNRWHVFWIGSKVFIRNLKICIIYVVKFEPFKGSGHFISTNKQWCSAKVIFSWLTWASKYKCQQFIHLFNRWWQHSIYFLHWMFKCHSICSHFVYTL